MKIKLNKKDEKFTMKKAFEHYQKQSKSYSEESRTNSVLARIFEMLNDYVELMN